VKSRTRVFGFSRKRPTNEWLSAKRKQFPFEWSGVICYSG
jgi:hypothetical protein